MEDADFREALAALRQQRQTGSSEGFEEFKAAVTSASPLAYGATHKVLAEQLRPIAQEFAAYLPSVPEEAQGRISSQVTAIGRGRVPELALPLMKWLWTYHNTAARRLFETIGYDAAPAEARSNQKDQAKEARDVIVARQESDYDVDRLIERARETLILVAQNHWRMTHNPAVAGRFWTLLRDAMKRGVDIKIVAMRADALPQLPTGMDESGVPNAVAVWSYHMNSGSFAGSLETTWNVFRSWAADAGALSGEGVGTLEFYSAYFVPLTLSVVDAQQDDGSVILSPRLADTNSANRPHIIIRKSASRDIFGYYAGMVADGFSNAGWRKAAWWL